MASKILLEPVSLDINADATGNNRMVNRHQLTFEKNMLRREGWTLYIRRVQILQTLTES